VNPAAATPRARIVWKIRSFTARVTNAAFVVEGLAAAPAPVVLPEVLPLELLEVLAAEIEDADLTTDDDATTDADATRDDETVEAVARGVLAAADVADPVVADPVGGGLASAGFESAPVPQGMA